MLELVAEAHRLTGRIGGVPWKRTAERDYFAGVEGNTSDAQKYREWVRERLSRSDLAQRIPGGREALPDILDAMPESRRSIERLGEPRNYRQLVRHLVKHLDWYLDPSQPVKPALSSRPFQVLVSVLALALQVALYFGVTSLFPSATFDLIWITVYTLLCSGLVYLASRIWGQHRTSQGTVFNFHPARNLIHAAELYYYLVDEWVDPGALEPPASHTHKDEPEPQPTSQY